MKKSLVALTIFGIMFAMFASSKPAMANTKASVALLEGMIKTSMMTAIESRIDMNDVQKHCFANINHADARRIITQSLTEKLSVKEIQSLDDFLETKLGKDLTLAMILGDEIKSEDLKNYDTKDVLLIVQTAPLLEKVLDSKDLPFLAIELYAEEAKKCGISFD